MSWFDRFRTRTNGAKSLTSMRHGGTGTNLSLFGATTGNGLMMPDTKIDYAKAIGDGLGSSVLAAPLNWLMRNFPQAPAIVERLEGDEWKEVKKHDLTDLLRNPNPFYGGRELWMVTALEFAFGNAFWLKIRNADDEVIQTWWVPRGLMEPMWSPDGSDFVHHYDYRPGGGPAIPVQPRDVVHFRFGMDPRNPRLGLSPLGALAREVFTDDQAANMASVILKNLGIIGVVISPKEKNVASKPDVEAVKAYIKENFTGDKRAEALALGQPTDVQLLQYNLQGFDTSPLRDVSEERVCAALGLPAAVVGFGTGLQQTKVGATMREMRRMAWTDGVIPLQDAIAEQLGRQLLTEFEQDTETTRVRFDLSKVPALEEEKNEKHNRVRADYQAGLIKRSQAKRELGYSVDATADEVYSQPTNILLLRPGQMPDNSGTPPDPNADPNADDAAPPAKGQAIELNLEVHSHLDVKSPDVHVTPQPIEAHVHMDGSKGKKTLTIRDHEGNIVRQGEITEEPAA